MAITTLNLRALNRSDTASSGQVITATSATAMDFQAAGGYWTLLKSITASSDSTISFVNGSASVVLDATYKQYMIRMIDVHLSAAADFTFNGSIDAGSNYNVVKMASPYATYHREGDASEAGIQYRGTEDSTLSTAFQPLAADMNIDADSAYSGEIILYNPAGTVHIKHYINHGSYFDSSSTPYAKFFSLGGYFNTTSAVNAIQFKPVSGNIDTGQFILYGAT